MPLIKNRTNTFIFFGGDIAVSIANPKGNVCAMALHELDNEQEVGSKIEPGTVVEENGIYMVFTQPDSIDVLIRALNRTKELLSKEDDILP